MGEGASLMSKDTAFNVPPEKHAAVRPKFAASSEKPAGEWNNIDIICNKSNLEIRVNGVLQNKATSLTQTSGSICLQSEGGPLQFRNVYVESLK
jgi:hypothetical protein